jgi:ribose 5-phosphate isomerase B
VKHLKAKGLDVQDYGPTDTTRCDYPDFALKAGTGLQKDSNPESIGVFVCGSGIGIGIAANKIAGVRCATCHDKFTAETARRKLGCNAVSLGERVIGIDIAKQIVDTYLANKVNSEEPTIKALHKRISDVERENLAAQA